ncbi:hypothetical protein [uncultured Thiohalocapsa sp.]|uniref:hypothetical protein n=1 Tax=uncultured Thiohalocapsa sp. TaxID=768990 RepID=UPI0025F1521B|nr:hypothetical protein [uncultured Thiohalocapsa sp.]
MIGADAAAAPLGAGEAAFRGYRLTPVYLCITDAERAEVIAMWRDANALRNLDVAEQRSREVVLLVRHAASGVLAGVSTVGLKPRPADGRLLYHYRMFVRPEHRQPHLMRAVTNATRDYLRDFRHPDAEPAGMLIVTENRKLMRPGLKRLLGRHGYEYRGRERRGLDVWLVRF